MNDNIEMVTVPLWKMERAANALENDGDESGVARDIRYMIKDAPKPEAQAVGVDGKLLGKLRCIASLLQQLNAQTACAAVMEAVEALSTPASHDAQQPAVVGDGMLPEVLWPHADEWYRLCERAPHATKIGISGELAEAIVKLAALTPAATPVPTFTPSDADRHRCLNCGLHVADHVPDEEGARCKRNAVETLQWYTKPPAQKEGNGNG